MLQKHTVSSEFPETDKNWNNPNYKENVSLDHWYQGQATFRWLHTIVTGFNSSVSVTCNICPLQMFLQSVLIGTHFGKELQGQ